MIVVIFESHGTTTDNENHLASGWKDVALSELGEQQSRELGERYANRLPGVVFCSALQRSYRTAELAFGDSVKIIRDARLNECDYGTLNGKEERIVKSEKPKRVNDPFPNGESYTQTTERMRSFLSDLKQSFDGKTVLIIGHRATQYALEHIILGKPLGEVIAAPWKWQPGWTYELE